jgi:type VI secretion system secreted protein Hcp
MKRVLLPILALGLCVWSPLSQAASDYLLEIEGIKGESSDTAHPNTIEIESFSWGVSNTSTFGGGGGGGAGKVQFQDFSFTMRASKATPKLILACATGQHIKEAKLFVRKSGGDGRRDEYYVITLTDVLVSSFQQSGSSGGGDSLPMEQISFSAARVGVAYTAGDGSVHTGGASIVDAAGGGVVGN